MIRFDTNRMTRTPRSYNNLTHILITSFLLFLIFFTLTGMYTAYGVKLFSKDEKPFGVPYDDYISKEWNWDLSMNKDQATPKPGGCLINRVDSMVMLMGQADVVSPPLQVCKISSKDGIMIPMWIAWCDSSEHPNYSGEQLTKCAREEYNLGNIRSEVKVDGVRVAKLDVRMSIIGGKLDYRINSLANVTEYYTKGFKISVPANTHKALTQPGTLQAGSHGWWVFLKPLPTGEHTIYYNVRVTPTGPLTSPGTNPHFADVAYRLQVQ